jgi:hypothetical protein
MGKKMNKGKSTLEVEWKNGKGEEKSFTINDIEKAFNLDEVKDKNFLQEGIKTIGKLENGVDASKKRGRYFPKKCEKSRSSSIECSSRGRYKYPNRSASHSCSKSSRSCGRSEDHGNCDKDRECDNYDKYRPFKKERGCDKFRDASDNHYNKDSACDYKNLKPYKREKLRRAYRKGKGKAKRALMGCGRGKYGKYRDYSRGKKSNCDRRARRSMSRDYRRTSRSRPSRNVYTMQHGPSYDMRGWDVGCETPQVYHPKPIDHYNRRATDQAYVNRNRDATRKQVNMDDVNRLQRQERCRRNQINTAAMNSRNNQNAKETKKYANRNNNKKKQSMNNEIFQAEMANRGKNANKFNSNLSNKRNSARQNSLDAKHSQNLMNIKDRCKEGLCMNEMDNDNLRADEKIIEEFDKLEHYKKINECNRSAEKNNNCLVKKRNDIHKKAKQCSRNAAKANRRRGANAYADSNQRDKFDYNDYMSKQANKKRFNDQNECLKNNKYLKACSDNASNDNACQDANTCNKDQQYYDNSLAKCNDRRYKNKDNTCNDRVCALKDQNMCTDEFDSPCDNNY